MAERPSSTSRRGWRGQAQAAGPPRNVARAAWSAVGLLLAVALAWLLLSRGCSHEPSLACLPVVHYDPGTVPPVAFSGEDMQEFRRLSARGPDAVPQWSDLESAGAMPKLGEHLEQQFGRSDEGLILYVSALGLTRSTDNGKPTACLVCSDFMLGDASQGDPSQGVCPLSTILEQVSRFKAPWKLLILDTGRLTSDRRLGMLVNDFPRLLEDGVVAVDDRSLWVLTANRAAESSYVCPAARRSAFGFFVTEGLRGEADLDDDGWVGLDELYRFVHFGVSDWSRDDADRPPPQQPWLLQGGTGAAEPPAGLRLMKISRARGRQASAAEAPRQEKTLAAEQGKAGKSAAQESGAATHKPDPDALLAKAWAICRQIEDRGGGQRWTPVDYAPHVWRELRQRLLGYEQRRRAGAAFPPDGLAEELAALVEPLEEFAGGRPVSADAGAEEPDRLQAAREAFRRTYGDGSKLPAGLQRHVQLRNDLLFLLPDYVKWCGLASQASGRTHPLYEPLARLLGAGGEAGTIEPYLRLLDSVEAPASSGAAGGGTLTPEALQAALDRLDALSGGLEEDRRMIESQLSGEAKNELAEKPPKAGLGHKLDSLLDTPLLGDAPLRKQLLELRLKADPPLASPAPANSPPAPPLRSRMPRPTWQVLRDQAELEVRLVALADPGAAGRMKLPDETSTDEDTLWKQYRNLGDQLRTFYRQLPERINAGLKSGDPVAGGLLRAVDPRDARRIDAAKAVAIAVPPLRLSAPPAGLAIGGPDEVIVDPVQAATPLRLSVAAADAGQDRALFRLRFDANKVKVEAGGEVVSSQAGMSEHRVPVESGRAELQCRVSALARDGSQTPLAASVECGGQQADRAIPLRLPSPDRVDLAVERIGRTRDYPVSGTGAFTLRPFPNRATGYRLALANRSPRPKRLELELLAVPAAAGERPTPERLLDSAGQPRDDVKQPAASGPVDLPAASEPKVVPLKAPAGPDGAAPATPAAAPPAAAADGSAPAGPEAAASGKPPITAGLACVLRDAGEPGRPLLVDPATGQPWVRYLQFARRTPRAYLEPVVRYRAEQREVTIDVDVSGQENLPSYSDEAPIIVSLSAGDGATVVVVRAEARLTPASPRAQLLARMRNTDAADAAPARLWLDVDGYPRAFLYTVPALDRDFDRIPPDEYPAEVRIASPKAGDAFGADAAIPVVVEVDAPADAFGDPDERVEVRLVGAERGEELARDQWRQFHADRQFDVRLNPVGADGALGVDAKVDDFRFAMRPGGMHARALIEAELLLSRRTATASPDRQTAKVEVVLDNRPPELDLTLPPGREVVKPNPLRVGAKQTFELSGIERITFGLDIDGDAALGPTETQQMQRQPGSQADWRGSVPTEKIEPGTYDLLVVAADRAGNQSRLDPVPITVKAPETGEGANGGAKTSGDIEGQVVWDVGGGVEGLTVLLEPVGKTAVTDAQGRFQFRDVPYQKYTIRVNGTPKGKTIDQSAEATLSAEADPARPTIVVKF